MIWGHREETLWRWQQHAWNQQLYYAQRKINAAKAMDWYRNGHTLHILMDVGYCLDAQTCNPSD
jgi:hypothetical protein